LIVLKQKASDIKEKEMTRPLRIEYAGAYYHVTSRGNEQKDVFNSRKDRERFLYYLETATERYGAAIHAYCLMSNHYHLLLETPRGNLSQIMRHINGAYTTYFNVKRKRVGHLFQGRYKAILIEADEYAKELSRYIHLNPVRAGMVERPEAFTWSSYNRYIGKEKSPEWLKTDFMLGYFDKKESSARKKYRQFVELMIGQKYESPLGDVVASTILGDKVFITEIVEKYLDRKKRDRDLPSLRNLSERRSVKEMSEKIYALAEGDKKLAKGMSIYICHRYSGAKLREIGDYFGISESGVTRASQRFGEKVKGDKGLKKLLAKVEHMLGISNA